MNIFYILFFKLLFTLTPSPVVSDCQHMLMEAHIASIKNKVFFIFIYFFNLCNGWISGLVWRTDLKNEDLICYSKIRRRLPLLSVNRSHDWKFQLNLKNSHLGKIFVNFRKIGLNNSLKGNLSLIFISSCCFIRRS